MMQIRSDDRIRLLPAASTLRGVARLFVLLALTACGSTPSETEDPVATTLTLSPTSASFTFINQQLTINATVRDQNGNNFAATVVWSSADEGVATVTDAGVVRAVTNGSTTITATVGSLTATATITIAQVATGVSVVSGNSQEAFATETLADPIVVRARDQGGTGVEGLTITFTPAANNGSVSTTSGVSDVDGQLSTMWTLGAPFGPQTLTASIDGAETTVSALSRSENPLPDLVIDGPLSTGRFDPTTLETITVSGTVRNQGDLTTGTGFRVALLRGATEIASTDLGELVPGGEAEVEFPVGPFPAGSETFTLVADADDAHLELNDFNNEAQASVTVKEQQTVSEGVTISGISAASNEEVLFRFDVPSGPTNLTVTIAGGTGDGDLYIEGGFRPANRTDFDDCMSTGPTNTETCQIVNASGTYHIILHGAPNPPPNPAGFSGLSLTVTTGDPIVPFNLELVFVDNGTAEQDQAFLDAAARWNEIIIGDIPDYDAGTTGFPANDCSVDGVPAVSGTIDDIKVFVAIRTIDGAGGTLARAGPCRIRFGSYLPITAFMEFDQADMTALQSNNDLEEVVLHEMAHALGIGTIWGVRSLLQAPSTSIDPDTNECTVSSPNNDTHFTGELARAAFDAIGGATYGNAKVPVQNGENGAQCGSADGHWRESVFDNELMTPFLNSLSVNPTSSVTIESLADLGYGVDVSQAANYTLPPSGPQLVAPGGTGSGGAAGLIDLRGDMYMGPIYVMEQGGRLRRVLR